MSHGKTTTPPRTLDRLIAQLETTIEMEREESPLRRRLDDFRRAIPAAQAALLTSDVLDAVAPGPMEDFLFRERDLALAGLKDEPTDPGHECLLAAVNETSVYNLGLAVGLLLAEVV